MKKIFFLAATFTVAITLNAQLAERIVVKAGDNIAEAMGPNGYFRFPKFTEGILVLKNGSKSRGVFNYNIMNGEMQYIDSKGDTMAIAVPGDIADITIGENTKFIYVNNSFLEIISSTPQAKLAKKIKVTVENDKKGGYGQSSQTSSQDQYTQFTSDSRVVYLSYDIALTKRTSYYWLDNKNETQPATKKNALRLVVRDNQAKLETFIEENKINFSKDEDLRKLLTFAGTL
jgi:hypothetical protein